MSSTSQSVVKGEYSLNFTLRYTAAYDLVSTILKELKILPKIGSNVLEEVVSCLLRPMKRNLTYG
jgi:hypothetical protein